VKTNKQDNDLLILDGDEIASLLAGLEIELIETVRMAYESHTAGHSSLPHSVFLPFPNDTRNRIIALPAYLGGAVDVAGLKWVSSFPNNLARGIDRASAVIILNSMETGRPEAILEGSLISAKRTAASAALAAKCLYDGPAEPDIGVIGCGFINYEVIRFLTVIYPQVREIFVYDIDPARAEHFKARCNEKFNGLKVKIASEINAVFEECSLISFGTTSTTPYVGAESRFRNRAVILHISLRDLSPEIVLASDNVVDDPDHVCRAQTSIHLAEQLVGNRDFIRCSLGEILRRTTERRGDGDGITIFSPFGLGILDMAVGNMVRTMGLREGRGVLIKSFIPDSWTNSPDLGQ
jgi:ornithine cyclodeaminase